MPKQPIYAPPPNQDPPTYKDWPAKVLPGTTPLPGKTKTNPSK
jgi:hypothetical protein